MARVPRSTIEQWVVLRTIIEEGGYSAAAAKLNRSQSSISYAVSRLQDAVGFPLLEIKGRRAYLTDEGTALLAEVIPVIDDLDRIEKRGRGLAEGETGSIRLFVDTLFPKPHLFGTLSEFAHRRPNTDVHLVETVNSTFQDVPRDEYDIAILIANPGAAEIDIVAEVGLVAVAHRDHPLHAASSGSVGKIALRRHPRVEIRGMESGEDAMRTAGRVWRMNTIDSAIDAVRHRLCYGWLPLQLIREEIESGTFLPLSLQSGCTRTVLLGLRINDHAPSDRGPIFDLGRMLGRQRAEMGEIAAPRLTIQQVK